MRRTGVIRRWVVSGGWGAYSYSGENVAPQKFFVHFSNAPQGAELDLGIKISFVPGPARSKADLPAALEIQVVSARPTTHGGAA